MLSKAAILKNPRLIAVVVVVAVILAAALWPSAMDIDIARVERGPMRVTIDEEGETRVRERFVVSAPVMGRVERIEIEPGDPVVRGKTVVARLTPAAAPLIDPRSQAELTAAVAAAGAAVGQARAERERAEATRTRAQSTLRRLEALLKAGAISGDELEAAQTSFKSSQEAVRAAEFSVARAEHELQLARARLRPSSGGGGTVAVVAPVDGVVLKRLRESASVVPVGEPLLEIGDPRSLEIVSDLLSTDAVRVKRGDAVLIEQWGGSGPLEGRVRRVEPSGFMKVSALGVEEQRVNVVLDFAEPLDKVQTIGDGFRVEAHVVVFRQENALKAPVGALFRDGDGWAVFTVEGGRASKRALKVARRNGVEAMIEEGLKAGDRVVVYPSDALKDGSRLEIRPPR
jgi:HlyD family secretion protein